MINKIISNGRDNYRGRHILAKDVTTGTDTWESGINNNVLIFGPSGAGKTRHYVKPNIIQGHESMIISDPKGSLYNDVGRLLEKRGYIVKHINFSDLRGGNGYNPLEYIRYDKNTNTYNEKDILTLASCLVDLKNNEDTYWEHASRQYLCALIGYVMEALPESEHNLESVSKLLSIMGTPKCDVLMRELGISNPLSTTARRYDMLKEMRRADRTDACIRGMLSTCLDSLVFNEALELYKNPDKIVFEELGFKKTAVFLTISDTDRSMDKLASAFVTQAISSLCRSADRNRPSCRLPVPVRFYLDDFATNLQIPHFDKIISVIRSREIYVSVILQSITQLESLYGRPRASTIINNCDQMLYLGGQDLDTVRLISERSNQPFHSILSMPLDKAYIFIRGCNFVLAEKYNANC